MDLRSRIEKRHIIERLDTMVSDKQGLYKQLLEDMERACDNGDEAIKPDIKRHARSLEDEIEQLKNKIYELRREVKSVNK